jgi:hypothetical protein
MDSFVFETRSLYEIMGKFLVALFRALVDRTVTGTRAPVAPINGGHRHEMDHRAP